MLSFISRASINRTSRVFASASELLPQRARPCSALQANLRALFGKSPFKAEGGNPSHSCFHSGQASRSSSARKPTDIRNPSRQNAFPHSERTFAGIRTESNRMLATEAETVTASRHVGE
jgi:hypothetical protein